MPRTKKGRFNLESTSSDDSDIEQKDRQHSSRVTNKPLRLGIYETGIMSTCVSSGGSEDDPFASNESLDVYLPSPKRKNNNVVRQNPSEKRVELQLNRTHQNRREEPLSSIASEKSNEPSCSRDFNSQFDMLRLRMEPSTSYSSRENTNNVCIASKDKAIGQKNTNKMSAGINVQPRVQPVFVGHNEPDEFNATDAVDFGRQVNTKLNEILARIATLEKMVITSATNSSGNAGLKKVTDQLNSEAQLFMKSNSLPTKNADELQKLDSNLRDPVFYTATVSV